MRISWLRTFILILSLVHHGATLAFPSLSARSLDGVVTSLPMDQDDCPESQLVQDLNNLQMSRSSFLSLGAMTGMVAPSIAQAATDFEDTSGAPRVESSNIDSESPGPSSLVASSSTSTTEPTSLQESISGFVAGAALAATKTFVKFPLDTATVRLQIPNSDYSPFQLGRLFQGSYNGVTLSLLSNIPGGAVFFAVKDATKSSLKSVALSTPPPRWLTTTIAVGAALFPYWLIRNPSEVIKVRQQVGLAGFGEGISALEAAQLTFGGENGEKTTLEGLETLYTGYWENILYGLPADVIKFVAYEAFTGGRRDLSPLEGARAGALATATAQLVTTPFDIIRNRRMMEADGTPESDITTTTTTTTRTSYVGSLVELGQKEGLEGLFKGASPRVAKAFVGGALQFAAYEETKQSIVRLLQGKKV